MVKTDNFLRLFGPRLVGLLLVLALHAAALYGLWSARLIPSPVESAILLVAFIAPPDEKTAPEPKRPPQAQPKPRQKPPEPPRPQQLVTETPVTTPADQEVDAPPSKPEPIQEPLAQVAQVAQVAQMAQMAAPVVQAPLPPGPVALSSELSVACPQRAAPSYPSTSRRLGEVGVVVVRVELSETGEVAMARVQSSSGFDRLDQAALAAVRTWHCTPPTRQGQPVRATALQPFNFVMSGN